MSSSSPILISSTNNTVVASADCNVDVPMTSEEGGEEAKVSGGGGGEREVPKKRKRLLCNGNINLLSSCSSYSPIKINSSSHEMLLLRLIEELRHNPHQKKDFVDIMLRDFSSRDSIRHALNQAFDMSLKSLKEALESASSSKVIRCCTSKSWVPNENEEIVCCDETGEETRTIISEEEEKTVAHYGDFMCWLVDRMIEWKVADTTILDKWIDKHGSLSQDFQSVCSLDIILPKFLFNVVLCTWKLANAVATGSIVADRQVRISLLKVWLPVMLHVKDMVLQFLPEHNHRFGEPFVKIISTLPMSESKELLLQCLGFSTQNVCPHLVAVYKTWFRRATQPPKDSDSEEIPPNVVNHQQPTDISSPTFPPRSWFMPCD